MTEATVEALLLYARSEGRVCPVPDVWIKFCTAVGIQVGSGQPLGPFILAGWAYSSDAQKAARLEEQIRHASETGRLEDADRLLRRLTAKDWHSRPLAPPRAT